MNIHYEHGQEFIRTESFLLLYREKYDDNTVEMKYSWFNTEEEMLGYIDTCKEFKIKMFIDYAGEILKDRAVLQRKFDRNISFGSHSREILEHNVKEERTDYILKKLGQGYGIDIEKEQIAGYPLITFFRLVHPIACDALNNMEMFFPPQPELHDFVVDMFIEALSVCEEEYENVAALNDVLIKRVIPKYSHQLRARGPLTDAAPQ